MHLHELYSLFIEVNKQNMAAGRIKAHSNISHIPYQVISQTLSYYLQLIKISKELMELLDDPVQCKLSYIFVQPFCWKMCAHIRGKERLQGYETN